MSYVPQYPFPTYKTQSFPYPEWPQSSTQQSSEEGHEPAEGGSCPIETNTVQGGSAPVVRGRQKKVAHREKNYSNKEDEGLCSAYLHVTKDPIVGANQSGTAYWKRVHQFYHEHKDFPGPARTMSSLSHRWGMISRATSLFTAMKAREDRLNQSGKTDEDRVIILVTVFKYKHCWRLLRGEPKWQSKVSGKGDDARKGKVAAGPSASGQGSDSGMPEDSGRPIGWDRAKKKLSSDQAATASSSACLEVLQDLVVSRKAGKEDRTARYEHLFDAEAKKIALKERMVHVQEEVLAQQRALMQFQMQEAQAAREDREERIMTMDLANLSVEARAYWKGRQAEILKSRNWTA
ncbi:hypothetical protein BAE44_0013133 [Dichanthelium oligosanthes]|uniref:No apical meristem-associated C-terminal domain-containing protein n=1 Tax=Dichanthelium oligosanthes TaxID=888268 RepID=A0A1E5VL42_9POAL|nr:hypothetical protein BAE44_0013133 [Dichanthelium oligosanthes]